MNTVRIHAAKAGRNKRIGNQQRMIHRYPRSLKDPQSPLTQRRGADRRHR
jgi:hypothetical protein